MKPRWLGVGVLFFLSAVIGADNVCADVDDIIESTFRKALVKVDVSSNSPVIRGGVNLCNSQGTGFLVSSSYVATAGHVVQVDPECGQPIILLKSRMQNVTLQAKVVGSKDDIALLKVAEPFPPSMCALGLMDQDVYDAKGYRFGIPGGLMDPASQQVKIGAKDSEFSPLVRLTATPAELGESGGPVVYYFNVVGVLKSKHKHYVGYSFMMIGSMLRSLMTQNDVVVAGKVCNPVEERMSPAGSAKILRPSSDLSAAAQATIFTEMVRSSRATQTSAQVRASFDRSVTITAEDRREVRSVCKNFAGIELCQPQMITVPGSGVRTASRAANNIMKDVNAELWVRLTGEAPRNP